MFGSHIVSSSQPTGESIAVESEHEWQIQEIGFDGIEKYAEPFTYSDRIEKLSRKVDWRKIIGGDTNYDNPDEILTVGDNNESETEESSDKLVTEERKPPEAGPWHDVAKHLHEALQQMNILVDVMKVMKTPYLEALTVADACEMQPNAQEVIQQSKQFKWVANRKSLAEAAHVFEYSQRFRTLVTEVEFGKELFFRELKKMRENWRIRKTGDVIFGDLGYKIYAPRYNPREIFDIKRRAITDSPESSNGNDVRSAVQIDLPRDLARRATVTVSIETDDLSLCDIYDTNEDIFDYTAVSEKKIREMHWTSALEWGQETLICRDMFRRLYDDAVLLQDRLASVRDGVLIVSLFDSLLLRIKLSYYPFEAGPLPCNGDRYLTRSLRRLFFNDLTLRKIRNQTFVEMPLTKMPEVLHLRGPLALTNEEIEFRKDKDKLLLEQLISTASHYILVNRVIDSLEEQLVATPDPQITWKWLRCSTTQSSILVTASNRNYDYAGKTNFYIRVDSDDFYIITKEAQKIQCKRDAKVFNYSMDFLICTYTMNTIATIASKLWQWQVMHANVNAVDDSGNACPTLYLCNQNSTWNIFGEFHLKGLPTIRVRKCALDIPSSSPMNPKDFTLINFNRLPGSSLCRKFDYLCEALRK